MKHLKKFNDWKIKYLCKKYGIKNYIINPDGSIDVDGDVYLNNERLVRLPLTFNIVSGSFYCYNNELTTLKGSPRRATRGGQPAVVSVFTYNAYPRTGISRNGRIN